MKLILGLFTILAIFNLGQAHHFPDFDEGSFYEEDFEDIIDLEEIVEMLEDHIINNNDVLDFLKKLEGTTAYKELLKLYFQAISEAIKFQKYLHNEGIDINHVTNSINKASKSMEKLEDFVNLIPMEKFVNIIIKYVNENEKGLKALFTLKTNTTECN